MSKGSPIVQVRIPAPLLAEVASEIALRNYWTLAEPWDRSAFIVKAIREFIAKRKRSRTRPRCKREVIE